MVDNYVVSGVLGKLSIIIPAYNVSEYIENTLLSILENTESISNTFEIIVVNDGSTDNTSHIVRVVQQKYPQHQIQLIDQENAGVSVARNRGIEKANGEYLWFVDGDDLIAENGINSVIRELCTLEDVDIDVLKMGNCLLYNDANVKNAFNRFKVGNNQFFSAIDLLEKASFMHTLYIWKRSFLQINNIRYPENITHNEDWLFLFRALLKAHRVCVNDTIDLYLIRVHEGSASRSICDYNSKSKMMASCFLVLLNVISLANIAQNEENRNAISNRLDFMIKMNLRTLVFSGMPLYFIRYYVHSYMALGIYPLKIKKTNESVNIIWKYSYKYRYILYVMSVYNWLSLKLRIGL